MLSLDEKLEKLSQLKAQGAMLTASRGYPMNFDGYDLGRAKEDISTKMGPAFDAGELVLVKKSYSFIDKNFSLVFSFKNACDTAVEKHLIEML